MKGTQKTGQNVSKSQAQKAPKADFDAEKYVSVGVSKQEVIDIKRAFDILDKDGSGTIDPNELRKAFEELGLLENNRLIYHILGDIDANCDGGINFEEFLKVASAKYYDEATLEDAQRVFDYFDADKSGKMTLLELQRMGDQLGEKISKDEYKEMFRRADLDCDGFVTVEDIQNIMNGKVYWDA